VLCTKLCNLNCWLYHLNVITFLDISSIGIKFHIFFNIPTALCCTPVVANVHVAVNNAGVCTWTLIRRLRK
jgi:hypothetical protein